MTDWSIHRRAALACCAAAIGLACTGLVGEGETPAGGGQSGGSMTPGASPGGMTPSGTNPGGMTPGGTTPGGMTPGGMSTPPTPGVPAKPLPADRSAIPACKAIDPGPSWSRRLNRREYVNTIRDVFGEQMLRDAFGTNVVRDIIKEFPVEEKRLGFDNNAGVLTVSPILAEDYFETAEKVAAIAVEKNVALLTSSMCDAAFAPEDMCVGRFFTAFLRLAYRRPATTEEVTILRGAYDEGRKVDVKTGLRLALTAVLQSPQFLYRIEQGLPAAQPGDRFVALTPYEMATRLSYLLLGSPPSPELRAAADAKMLETPAQLAAMAERLIFPPPAAGMMPPFPVANGKTKSVVGRFFEQWLEIEKLRDVEKDTKTFPLTLFPRSQPGQMELELEGFLDEAIWNPMTGGTLKSLYTGTYSYMTPTLHKFYGGAAGGVSSEPMKTMAMDSADRPARVTLDGEKRGGLLTQGALMVVHANANQTSPVRRGVFVREQLLCQPLQPPPPNLMVTLPPLNTTDTTRERFDRHRSDPACAACHSLIDPIGVGFETLDSIGRYQTTENGKPIDARGEVVGSPIGKFQGPVDLGRRMAVDDAAATCVVRQWFRQAYGREEEDKVDDCTLELLKRKFLINGGQWKDLLIALTQTDTFLYKRNVQPGGPQ